MIVVLKMQEMENEAKAAPVQYRTQMLGRLRNYRRDLDQMSRDVVNIIIEEFEPLHGKTNLDS